MDRNKKNAWLGVLFVIGLVCMVLGFDPLGQFIGKQGMLWITGAIVLLVVVYECIPRRKKKK